MRQGAGTCRVTATSSILIPFTDAPVTHSDLRRIPKKQASGQNPQRRIAALIA